MSTADRGGRVVPWLLLAAAAVPLLLALVAGDRVLAGGIDGDSYPSFRGGASLTVAPNLVDRLGGMLSTVDFATALSATAIGVLALTGLSALPGAHPAAPSRPARAAAQLLAAAGTGTALLVTSASLWTTYGPLTPLQRELNRPAPDEATATIAYVVSFPLGQAAGSLAAAVLMAAGWFLLRRGPVARREPEPRRDGEPTG
ncbi:hypothetical protein CLV92_104157 [Kineococcus xinjiangensis]|uniref:Uncharacterized protein n=1 Tax=Kineococcus xinjiangensis TaxID=512762 RepID=A0A2S6ITF9_9ACTN|nr:hypothetical protein [Kineococcus xinjiangensis]PPK97336.1 hypothetical protein CLV92_104157 [Kineococcus xinjiangensis]